MRIITGVAKGIRLKTLEGDNTRPTTERVKEAVFSMLQFDIDGRTVLDLFAGSGQMALEALSRGATKATVVDKSKDAITIIKENSEKTRLSEKCNVIQADYLDFIRHSSGIKYDIIFLDPPYALKMYIPALLALFDNNILKPSSLIVCESGEEIIFDENSNLKLKFQVKKQSKYGKIYITVLMPKL